MRLLQHEMQVVRCQTARYSIAPMPIDHAAARGRQLVRGVDDVGKQWLHDAEKAEVWPRLVALWPAYDTYVEVSGRNIRVFRLAPV